MEPLEVLTLRELLSVFKKHGIEIIAPQVGDRFDPQQHQAMFKAPVQGRPSRLKSRARIYNLYVNVDSVSRELVR